jgi:hypothetical protein
MNMIAENHRGEITNSPMHFHSGQFLLEEGAMPHVAGKTGAKKAVFLPRPGDVGFVVNQDGASSHGAC